MKKELVFGIDSEKKFNEVALEVFRFQYKNTEVYRQFVDYLNITAQEITHYADIPFLPIEFFKSQIILNKKIAPHNYFLSSGTTTHTQSKHYIADISWYHESLLRSFSSFMGNPQDFVILGLLPNYLENSHSSLIYMVNELMKISKHKENGFYLYNEEDLYRLLQQLEDDGNPTLLFGVSFALLDFVENRIVENKNLTIIETGGMKGRKTESTKEAVLRTLQERFPNAVIASEYGMTELFSQAYAIQSLFYQTPPWMKLLLRELEDPQSLVLNSQSGAINVIDLANINSCSFIATSDLGRKNEEGNVEILGRIDHSDIRGCSLLLL